MEIHSTNRGLSYKTSRSEVKYCQDKLKRNVNPHVVTIKEKLCTVQHLD